MVASTSVLITFSIGLYLALGRRPDCWKTASVRHWFHVERKPGCDTGKTEGERRRKCPVAVRERVQINSQPDEEVHDL